jgi:hypothetical protein
MSAPAPELAIVIVSYNARGDLEACLGSLAAAPPAVPHEILVVDNASNDGGPAMIRDRWPSVRLLPQSRNLGFAAGCNVGIRASAAGLILLLNGDTLVPPHAIDRLVDRLRASDEVAVAGPRLVDAEGLPELSFGRMISPFAELRQKILTGLLARRVGPAVARVRRLTAVERHPDWVSGACLLVRRADAEAVGLLDERYFLYTEDVDFCAAIRARGRRVLFTPAAEVVHLRGRSRAAASDAAERAYRASQLAFYGKHRPAWTPWLRAYLRLRGKLPG